MSNEDTKITYAESISIRIAAACSLILDTHPDICLASTSGYALDAIPQTERNGFGLLLGRNALEWPTWWKRTFHMRPRRPFICSIYVNNDSKKAAPKKWLMEVSGREYLDLIKVIAADLSEKFEVEIHIRLESEVPGEEYLPGGYDYD